MPDEIGWSKEAREAAPEVRRAEARVALEKKGSWPETSRGFRPLKGNSTWARRHPFALAAIIILGVAFVLMSISDTDSERVSYFIMSAAALFAPTFVADARLHRNRAAIFALNLILFAALAVASKGGVLFFGLALIPTGVGWIVALVWSFTSNRMDQVPRGELLPPSDANGLYKETSVEEKTCPTCAERIKAAAFVCHFCGHKFTSEEVSAAQRRNAARADFPDELNEYLYRIEKDGRVSAANGRGERIQFNDWRSFWKTAHPEG